jgi:hypothetical protein
MFKILFGLVAALLFSSAHAALTPTTGSSCYAISFTPWGTFTAADPLACAQAVVAEGKTRGSIHPDQVATCSAGTAGDICGWNWVGSPHGAQVRVSVATVCPANSTLSGVSCTCDSGHAEVGGSCSPTSATCPVGQGKTTNRTEGWARSPNINANDVVEDLGPPSSLYGYNDGVCVGNITRVERCFRSAEPSAQGLYRISCDYTIVVTGPSTSSGDATSDPAQAPASCPGFVGEVNGKTVCVGTASNPLPAGTDAPNDPTSAGNPSAGPKPSTGPGSGSDGAGRTPTTGSGGNSGGPASAAIGPGGSGLRNSEGSDESGEVCGASPLPACNVKVDEAGVPAEGTASQRFQQGLIDLAQVETDSQARINDAKESDLPEWSWTFALPTGCAPYAMEAFGLELDVCQFQPIIHDIMSFLWLSAGVFGLLALFRQSVGT